MKKQKRFRSSKRDERFLKKGVVNVINLSGEPLTKEMRLESMKNWGDKAFHK
jgi:hypothetical protein